MNQIQLRLTLAPILGFLILCSVVQEAIAFERWAPVHRAKDIGKEEIRDEQGRIYYIIDLAEGSDEPYEDAIVEDTQGRWPAATPVSSQISLLTSQKHISLRT